MAIMMDVAMFGWLPFCIFLFATFPPRRALIAGFIISWLFLPITEYPLPALPDYDKTTASIVGVLMGAFLFDHQRLLTFRPKWFDTPMLIWCVSPFFASLSNGLGVWDGLSASVDSSFAWVTPYFLGRVYFRTVNDLRDLVIGIFISGVIYIPFCLFEWRFSPQIHRMVYGAHQHDFIQSIRAVGYRPLVFMQNGLILSMWMMVAALSGFWLWRYAYLRRFWELSAKICVIALLGVTLICQSVNAIGLLAVGLGVLYVGHYLRTPLPLLILLMISPSYVYIRTMTHTPVKPVIELVAKVVGDERGRSVQTRFVNEERLMARAWERPLFGWGRWGRSRVYNSSGEDISKTDGLWIIALGQTGFLGLISILSVFITPVLVFLYRYPPQCWGYTSVAPALVVAVTVALFSVDNLLNVTSPPVTLLCMGGLVNLPGQVFIHALAGNEHYGGRRISCTHTRFI